MDISIFLAKIMGIYMLVLGLVLLKKPSLQKVVNELSRDEGLRFVLGLFTFIMGIVLITVHNFWTGDWRVAITLVSWIIFLKGLASVWLEEKSYRNWVDKFSTKNMVTASGIITLIAGLFLTYVGFFI